MSYTREPWTLSGKYPSARVKAGNFEFLLTNGKGALPSEWLANARLIAAAPRLLSALRMAEAYASLNIINPRPPTSEQIAEWRDIIAEAEGRS